MAFWSQPSFRGASERAGLLTSVTKFVQEPRTLSYGLGASTLVAGLCLVPFSVTSLLASRTTAPITKLLSARFVLVGGSLIIAAASETGSAMGLYQVIRYIGFSLGSARAASILAGNIARGSQQVTERGYVGALWVGTVICALAAGVSWLLSRGRAPISPQALAAPERERLALEDAELATAGLVGVEAELQRPASPTRAPNRATNAAKDGSP
jgi:hypothetical protein